MTDPRTFTLIGEFKDGITPELQKINNQLAALKTNFTGVGSKKNTGFRGASQEIGKLVSAHKNLSKSLQEVQGRVRSTTKALNEYRLEMAKAAKATREFKKAGGSAGSSAFAQNMRAANNEAKQYLRTLQAINKATPRAMRPPSGGGGRSGGRGGGGGGAGPGGFHMAEFGFAFTLGTAIAQPIQNAVISGFQIGVGLMTKPFEYFANRLGERMQDELSDLKAAGGFFSMAKKQKDPFVKNFADAIQFTQENNKVMAELAASLPGKTQDYIEVAKRISDSVARTVLNDRAATMKMAEQIRAGDIRTYGAKSITEMSGQEATRKTIQVLLGDLTKDTVLAGMGGRAGAGGAMGAYGLPQLSERMISQDEVSMGQMQRYSAIFSDPMIMTALQNNIDKINATSKNSADRLQAIANMYKEVVTPELVERYRRTLAGVAETFNTAIFGEETGIFGLGRKMQIEINGKEVGLGIRFNEFGQMLDELGNVTTDVTKAARDDLAIYDLFRDILVNVGQVIAPIVENLSLIYDPLKQLGIDLNKAREATYKVLESFNYYKKGFEEFGKQFKGKDKEDFDATRELRAALATVGNVMRYFKVIGEGDFANLIKELEDPQAEMGPILQKMIDQFLKSDVAGKIGEFIGGIIGSVLTEVAKATGFISGRLEQSNKLLDGLKKGFDDAGGTEAIKNIFKDVFKSLFNLLVKILTLIPIEGYMLMGFMLVAPAAAQALGMAIGSKIASIFGDLMGPLGTSLVKGAGRTAPKVTGAGGVGAGRAGGGGGLVGAFTTRRQAAYARLMRQRSAAKTAPLVQGAKTLGAFGKDSFKGLTKALGASKFGQAMTKVAKFIPGGAVAAGVLDAGIRMMSGQGAGQALGGAGAAMGGSAIGAAIGSIIAPGIGTAIGGIAGGLLGDYAFQKLSPLIANLWPWADRQKIAADKQLSAAEIQMAAAEETRRKLGIPDVGAAASGVNDPGKLMKVLEMMGLSGDKQARTLLQQSGTLDLLTQRTSEAGNLLNAKINELRKLKYTDAQIASQGDVKALQANFNRLQKESKTAAENLNKTFAAMPQATSRGITTAMQKLDTKTIEYAIANKINMMSPPKIQWNNIAPGAPTPGAPSPIFTPPAPAPAAPSPKKGGWALGNPFGSAKGSLGDAIASEMRMKPPGSDLVIANSSETVIPAAGGYGMKDFMSLLTSGFTAINNQYKSLATGVNTLEQDTGKKFQQAETTNTDRYQKTTSTLNNYHKENQKEFAKIGENVLQLSQKVASMSSMGGLFGGGGGGMDLGSGYGGAGVKIAGALGNFIKQTGGAPGSIHEHPAHGGVKGRHAPGSYHYSGRAIDIGAYANEQAGVIARIKQFNAKYGVKPVEFLHAGNDPNHQDHVHVAYALGKGNPAFFSSQNAAERWEASMAGRMNVRTVTGNTMEGFGGSTVGDIYVTVNAGATSDPDQLAYMVAERIQEAVGDAVNANILV